MRFTIIIASLLASVAMASPNHFNAVRGGGGGGDGGGDGGSGTTATVTVTVCRLLSDPIAEPYPRNHACGAVTDKDGDRPRPHPRLLERPPPSAPAVTVVTVVTAATMLATLAHLSVNPLQIASSDTTTTDTALL